VTKTFELSVVTAEQEVHRSEATFIVLRGGGGDIGILAGHTPLLTTVSHGPMRIDHPSGESEYLFVSGGFLEVLPDRVTILADTAERGEDIDEAAAEEARKRAQIALQEHVSDEGRAIAEAAFERAIGRLKVGELRRKNRQR
jgi:F-type H+-transporting ATPase subunit epsilon